MEKEKIFSKFSSKDYNNQLETILEEKKYPEIIKNLLLSMLYNIETAYKDYSTVKKEIENKNTYIEEILEIIKEKCDKIIIPEENSEEMNELRTTGTNYLVDMINKTIYIIHPNEKILLYTLYKINNKQIYLEEKYNLIRNAFSKLLNVGENSNKMEVIRDFNGWTWDVEPKEIYGESTSNIIYQNLIYLLNIETVRKWTAKETTMDYIFTLEEELKNKYGEELKEKILDYIYKISIIICVQKNAREKARLLEEKEEIQNEFDKMSERKEYLQELSNTRKEQLEIIKSIDEILNDKELLLKEFEIRNSKRAKYNQIYNLNHMKEILNKERKKALNKMEEASKLLEPNYFVSVKQELENKLDLLSVLDVENYEKEKNKYLLQLQKVFLECIEIQIKNATEKADIINLIYKLRYYNFLYLTRNKQIKDVSELSKKLDNIQCELMLKACESKIFTRISKSVKENYEIIKNVFTSKIISLENINVEIKINRIQTQVNIYDKELFEKSIIIPRNLKENLDVKQNKKIKIIQ